MIKHCTKCDVVKETTLFSKRARSPDGLASWCKQCMTAYKKRWVIDNPDKHRAHALKSYHKDPSKNRVANREWYRNNRGKNRAKTVQYKLAKINRTPPWADLDAIRAISVECARRRAAGENVVVDHIVPLRGKYVSGLHVHQNLRIIPHDENARKGNKFELDHE